MLVQGGGSKRPNRVARGIQFLPLGQSFSPQPFLSIVYGVNRQPNLDVSPTRGCPLAFHSVGSASIYIALRVQLPGILPGRPRPTGLLIFWPLRTRSPSSKWSRSRLRSSISSESFHFSWVNLLFASSYRKGTKIEKWSEIWQKIIDLRTDRVLK